MEDFVIRDSRPEDLQGLMELDLLVWNKTKTPAVIQWDSVDEYAAAHPAGSQLAAFHNGKVCGYAHFHSPTPLLSNQHVAELAVAVHPGCQGMGVGKQLLETLVEKARSDGKVKLALRVMETNQSAVEFYKTLGFAEQGRLIKEFFINDQYVDDILMYKIINPT
ncbi:GNAT family N-acetyltransferase [Bacillus marinisedimentorum]|uniref:GNAT family N-acetyltransferase n=1 Tax=Bacillus marinisedimentorum TaxID=1821260 RepID=UPI0007E08141|nr:GNAT family N-acetyltransferase [Bacillus marinisedimentorum]